MSEHLSDEGFEPDHQQPAEGVSSLETNTTPRALSTSTVFRIFADERRRYVCYCLHDHDGEAPMDVLVERIAAWKSTGSQTDEQHERITADLNHVQLPLLADSGVVDYDEESGTVTFTELGDQLSPHLEFAKGTEGNAYLDVEGGADDPGSREGMR